jgi:hypothetical protein
LPIKKVDRRPEVLGALSLFALLDNESSRALTDIERIRSFSERPAHGLGESLTNEARLHGWRAQALFEWMVVELGGMRLLKVEDEGTCYFDDELIVKVPDFRVVSMDGTV